MTTFFLSLKRLVFSKGFILSLFILPVILIITSVGFKNSENKTIAKSGIFFEASDDTVFFEKLLESDNFIVVNSYEELEKENIIAVKPGEKITFEGHFSLLKISKNC